MVDFKSLKEIPPYAWPDNAGEIFLEIMNDKTADEEDRLVAAELAGDIVVIDDVIAAALLAILKNGDESEELRGQAAISLGPVLEETDIELEDDYDDDFDEDPDYYSEEPSISPELFQKITESLQHLYYDAALPKQVRRRVLEGSIRAPREWHTDAVRAAYQDGDAEWRLTAVFCMQYIPGFEEQIMESLNDPEPLIQEEAIISAGGREVEAAWPHVKKILNDAKADKDLLLAAITAAPFLNTEEAADIFYDFEKTGDEDIDLAVEEALAVVDSMLHDGYDDDDDDDDDYYDDDDDF